MSLSSPTLQWAAPLLLIHLILCSGYFSTDLHTFAFFLPTAPIVLLAGHFLPIWASSSLSGLSTVFPAAFPVPLPFHTWATYTVAAGQVRRTSNFLPSDLPSNLSSLHVFVTLTTDTNRASPTAVTPALASATEIELQSAIPLDEPQNLIPMCDVDEIRHQRDQAIEEARLSQQREQELEAQLADAEAREIDANARVAASEDRLGAANEETVSVQVALATEQQTVGNLRQQITDQSATIADDTRRHATVVFDLRADLSRHQELVRGLEASAESKAAEYQSALKGQGIAKAREAVAKARTRGALEDQMTLQRALNQVERDVIKSVRCRGYVTADFNQQIVELKSTIQRMETASAQDATTITTLHAGLSKKEKLTTDLDAALHKQAAGYEARLEAQKLAAETREAAAEDKAIGAREDLSNLLQAKDRDIWERDRTILNVRRELSELKSTRFDDSSTIRRMRSASVEQAKSTDKLQAQLSREQALVVDLKEKLARQATTHDKTEERQRTDHAAIVQRETALRRAAEEELAGMKEELVRLRQVERGVHLAIPNKTSLVGEERLSGVSASNLTTGTGPSSSLPRAQPPTSIRLTTPNEMNLMDEERPSRVPGWNLTAGTGWSSLPRVMLSPDEESDDVENRMGERIRSEDRAGRDTVQIIAANASPASTRLPNPVSSPSFNGISAKNIEIRDEALAGPAGHLACSPSRARSRSLRQFRAGCTPAPTWAPMREVQVRAPIPIQPFVATSRKPSARRPVEGGPDLPTKMANDPFLVPHPNQPASQAQCKSIMDLIKDVLRESRASSARTPLPTEQSDVDGVPLSAVSRLRAGRKAPTPKPPRPYDGIPRHYLPDSDDEEEW